MRKLSEIKGEDALKVLAKLIKVLSEFYDDKEFVALVRSGKRMDALERALDGHGKAIIVALAIIEGEDPNTFAPSALELPNMIIEQVNDPQFQSLFPWRRTVTSSGSAMENTEATEEK